jgi:hypothetical protein
MINFTKSGNHNSNFTKAAIIAMRDQGLVETAEEDFDDADADAWLNERQGLVNFVSRQIPGNIQVDSMATSVSAVSETKRNNEACRRSPDLLVQAIHELAESRKRPVETVNSGINESINNIFRFSTRKEEIDLITIQIDGLKQRMAAMLDNVKKERYAQGIATLEEKLDDLLFNCPD